VCVCACVCVRVCSFCQISHTHTHTFKLCVGVCVCVFVAHTHWQIDSKYVSVDLICAVCSSNRTFLLFWYLSCVYQIKYSFTPKIKSSFTQQRSNIQKLVSVVWLFLCCVYMYVWVHLCLCENTFICEMRVWVCSTHTLADTYSGVFDLWDFSCFACTYMCVCVCLYVWTCVYLCVFVTLLSSICVCSWLCYGMATVNNIDKL